jgi:general secretion pathway protein J
VIASQGKAGFTLLEVLVALTVMGFLLVGLTQGWRFGLQAWDRQSSEITDSAELNGFDRTIRGLLTHIEPGSGAGPPIFNGTPNRMDFISDLPSAVATPTRRADMALLVESKTLVLRWALHRHEIPRAGKSDHDAGEHSNDLRATDTEILSDIEQIEISYWRPDSRNGQAGEWQSAWVDKAPPQLLRLHLVFPVGDRRHWPDIVVAPMIGKAAAGPDVTP